MSSFDDLFDDDEDDYEDYEDEDEDDYDEDRTFYKKNWVLTAGSERVCHYFCFCDWCHTCRSNDIPHHIIHIRTSDGDVRAWVCQMCMDERYLVSAKDFGSYITKMKRRLKEALKKNKKKAAKKKVVKKKATKSRTPKSKGTTKKRRGK